MRLGAPEDFASAYLADILGQFAASHPMVELHVTCQLTLPLVEEFSEGRQDLIVVPQGLAVLTDGWPVVAAAEIALLGAARQSAATQALAAFIAERVRR